MKECTNCRNQLLDEALYCPVCGATQESSIPSRHVPEAPVFQTSTLEKDPYDHTGEYDMEDISNTKLLCMAAYLLDFAGVIIALLAARESPYATFHIRQSLKFTMIEVLLGLICGLLVWTVLVPIVGGLMLFGLIILKLIAFTQVCKNQAKEPALIRSLTFLN